MLQHHLLICLTEISPQNQIYLIWRHKHWFIELRKLPSIQTKSISVASKAGFRTSSPLSITAPELLAENYCTVILKKVASFLYFVFLTYPTFIFSSCSQLRVNNAALQWVSFSSTCCWVPIKTRETCECLCHHKVYHLKAEYRLKT